MTRFGAARAQLETIVGWLSGPAAAGSTHAQLEERLTTDGRELLRLLLQDHLDVRAEREPRLAQVVDADRVVRTTVEPSGRQLATVFGHVRVDRLAYRHAGAANLHPADAALNLPAEKHSHGLRRLAAVEAPADPTTTPPTRSPGPRAPRWANARPNSSPSAQRPTSRRSTPPDGPPQPTPTTCW